MFSVLSESLSSMAPLLNLKVPNTCFGKDIWLWIDTESSWPSCFISRRKWLFNPLLLRCSFWRINTRQLLKTLWENDEQFLLFPQCFLLNHIIVSPFVYILTSYLYLKLNWKTLEIGIWAKGLKLIYILNKSENATHTHIYIHIF